MKLPTSTTRQNPIRGGGIDFEVSQSHSLTKLVLIMKGRKKNSIEPAMV